MVMQYCLVQMYILERIDNIVNDDYLKNYYHNRLKSCDFLQLLVYTG